MQTFLYPNNLPSKEPYATWALIGEEPAELSLPMSADRQPYTMPRYAKMSMHLTDEQAAYSNVERWRHKLKVSWVALHAYWAWCVGKPLVSHQEFAFVCRCIQQAEAEDHSLTDHIYPLEPHCPNSWSPVRQPNYSFVPSRYPRWIRDVMSVVPLDPVCPWNDERADPGGFYKNFYTT